jgi:hypothetical protein
MISVNRRTLLLVPDMRRMREANTPYHRIAAELGLTFITVKRGLEFAEQANVRTAEDAKRIAAGRLR